MGGQLRVAAISLSTEYQADYAKDAGPDVVARDCL
jgi:hypothetical protein